MSEPTPGNIGYNDTAYAVGTFTSLIDITEDTNISPTVRQKILRDQLLQTPTYLEPEIPKNTYLADSEVPALVHPEEEEQTTGETGLIIKRPYKLAERQVIRQHLSAEFAKALNEYASQQGRELAGDDLEEILRKFEENPDDPNFTEEEGELAEYARQKAFANTKAYYSLPPNWSPRSSRESDWTPMTTYGGGPQELTPYSPKKQEEIHQNFEKSLEKAVQSVGYHLTPRQQEIVLSLAKNPHQPELIQKYPSLNEVAKTARQIAISETRGTYSLDSTWMPGTKDPSKWTPIQTGPINVQARNSNQVNNMLNNSVHLADEQTELLQQVLSLFPEGSEVKLSSDQVMAVVLEALQELKKYLYEAGSEQDTKRVESLSENRISLIQKQLSDVKEQQKLAEKAKEKQSAMTAIQGCLIALGVLITIFSILASPFTLGVTIGLVVVGVAMISIGIANMTTGFMDKGIQALIQWLADELEHVPGMEKLNEATRKYIIEAILVVMIVAIVVVLTVVSGGQASSIAGQAISTVATQVGTQLAMQVLATTLADMVINMLLASPNPEVREFAEKNQWWIRMIIGILVAIAAVGLMAAQNKMVLQKPSDPSASAGSKLAGKLSPEAMSRLGRGAYAMQGTAQATQVAGGLAAGGIEISAAFIQRDQDDLEADLQEKQALIKMIDALIDRLVNAQKGNLQSIQSAEQAQKHFLRSQQKMTSGLWQA